MRVGIMTITPEKAKELLDKSPERNFRKLDDHRVRQFAEEMRRGNWECNGETIKLNGDVLLDGQHRLHAVVASGVKIKTAVAHDVVIDTAMTIDRGKPRTIAQWLSYNGIQNATAIAGMAKLCVCHSKGLWGRVSFQVNILDSEQIEFVGKNLERLVIAQRMADKVRRGLPLSPTILGSILFLGCLKRHKEHPTADWFCRGLYDGAGLTELDAALHLRNRILNQSAVRPMTQTTKRFLATIAWNKTVRGEGCASKQLRILLTGPNKQEPPQAVEQVGDD